MIDDFRALLFVLVLIFFVPIALVGGFVTVEYVICNTNITHTKWCDK
jgi:hypothetical protein